MGVHSAHDEGLEPLGGEQVWTDLRVHDKGAVLDDGLADGPPRDEQELEGAVCTCRHLQ